MLYSYSMVKNYLNSLYLSLRQSADSIIIPRVWKSSCLVQTHKNCNHLFNGKTKCVNKVFYRFFCEKRSRPETLDLERWPMASSKEKSQNACCHFTLERDVFYTSIKHIFKCECVLTAIDILQLNVYLYLRIFL